ncbi:extracellular calcium-sensing receptor-like [Pelobates cultripes]|uniref:Extracellular calcium-sensing receptor-like n=1 Tax=Pelobates cultripes TaxID=61616 RepID=A0AAD1RIT7_PELCU|nr:extracellular calcium-sensing receptor-like [Pelobates cultripes]
MIFAVEKINANSDLLPNITLGFKIFDTCAAMRRAVEGTFWMLSGGSKSIPSYQWQEKTHLAGIIGDSGSVRSILMAQILGIYRYPQISYFSTSPIMSNRNQFPSFFRTIPSDEFQSRGLAQLVTYFGWSWVGLLAIDNDYGLLGIQVIKEELLMSGACVAFVENILTNLPNRNAPHIVKTIRESTAHVIVVFSLPHDFIPVLEELQRQNVSGKIWVASESWSTSALLSSKRFQEILVGTIGFAIHSGWMLGFTEYLNSFHPSKYPDDDFAIDLWEHIFSCNWFERRNNRTTQECTGGEKLESYITKPDFRLSFNVYTCVYTFAWALQSLLQCKSGSGPFHEGECANISSFRPWQVSVKISVADDKTRIFFNHNGDPPAIYDIVNWQLGTSGDLEQVIIGIYNSSAPHGNMLILESTSIKWNTGDTQVPYSKCSLSCPLGFQKVTISGKPTCCYECAHCPHGKISNQTDAVECHQCSWDMWPNQEQDTCLLRGIEFLSYKDLMGVSLAAIAFFSSTVPVCILVIFFYHRTTPIVRANNWSLSCLLLVSLSFCFLCSLAFIGYPQPEMCLLRQVFFGMVFTLCISCVLAKTITVVIAFKATKPGSRLQKWSGIKVSYCAMGICVLIQLCICVLWLSCSPPFPEYDTQTLSRVIIVTCNEGLSGVFFWIMLGYLGLLAAISFIFAFLARHLPDSFNEAKLITFSMLAFLSVWVSFVPAYFSARGKNMVAMEIFAILCSSWAVVICIFVPKCFIILFRPNMNSREHLMKRDKEWNHVKFTRYPQEIGKMTVPSDSFQSKGLAQLVLYFGWTWVGLLAVDDDYGRQGIQVIMQELSRGGACVEFVEYIMTNNLEQISHLTKLIKQSTAKVIVSFTEDTDNVFLLEEMLRQDVTGKIFVASEAWSISNLLSIAKYSSLLSGSVGLSFHSATISGFGEFLNTIHPTNFEDGPWTKTFWEKYFGCKFLNQTLLTNSQNDSPLCLGNESILNTFYDVSNLNAAYNLYMAIHVIAKSLDDMRTCQKDKAPFNNESCADIQHFKPWQLSHYIQNVKVKLSNGRELFFDQNGDPPAVYDIINWHMNTDGTKRHVKVGSYDTTQANGNSFLINTSALIWASGQQQVPVSVCTQSCLVGFRKVLRRDLPVCCFECILCPLGQISNKTAENTQTQPGIIIVECNEGSPTAFWSMLGYLSFLATISFIVAFLARRLPDSFNEAKFITFSMLAFLSVWVSYIPASLSSTGKYSVAMEVFAILSSSWALLICMFVPKCFIILFRSDMNSKQHLMGKLKI